MLRKIIALSFMAVVLNSAPIKAMQKDEKKSKKLVWHSIISGEGACHGSSFSNNKIIFSCIPHVIQSIGASKFDFGQDNCTDNLGMSISGYRYHELVNENRRFLIAAAGRGTTTVINWLAEKPQKEQEENAHFLVLESFVGSGNSIHTMNTGKFLFTFLPFARAWLPLINKCIYPAYKPWGQQASSSAKKLSPKIPVILMHHTKNPYHSINETRQLYCTLRNNNNDNVYLLEIDNNNNSDLTYHDILNSETRGEKNRKMRAIQEIYKNHGVPFVDIKREEEEESDDDDEKEKEHNEGELREFQPSVKEIEEKIYNSTYRSRYARNAIDLLTGGLLVGGFTWWCYKKYMH